VEEKRHRIDRSAKDPGAFCVCGTIWKRIVKDGRWQYRLPHELAEICLTKPNPQKVRIQTQGCSPYLFQELRKVKVWETEGKHFSEGMHG